MYCPKIFKAHVVQECLQSGVSMASVALRRGINANLVRKWNHQSPVSTPHRRVNYIRLFIP
ncbi:transposase [Pseudomonas sp. P154a]|nr:transposase [Pseudomonas mucoides]